jgi:hypothetical protein
VLLGAEDIELDDLPEGTLEQSTREEVLGASSARTAVGGSLVVIAAAFAIFAVL